MKRVLFLLLSLILLLGITSSGTFNSFEDTETSFDNQITILIHECHGEKFNIVNNNPNNKIFKYNSSGQLLGTLDLASQNSKPSGAASLPNYIYVLDQADKQVYRYCYCGETPVAVSKVLMRLDDSSTGNPSGLAIYGNNMWAVLSGPNNPILYLYPLSAAFSGTGVINSTRVIYPHPDNDEPTGLAIDSSYLYVVDEIDKRIYRYPHEVSGAPVVSKELKGEDGSALSLPSGAMVDLDNNSIWVVDRGTDKTYEYPLEDDPLFTGGGPDQVSAIDEFTLDSENDYPTGL